LNAQFKLLGQKGPGTRGKKWRKRQALEDNWPEEWGAGESFYLLGLMTNTLKHEM